MLKEWPGTNPLGDPRGPDPVARPREEERDARRTLGAFVAYVLDMRKREGLRDPNESSRARVHLLSDPIADLYVEEVTTKEVRAWMTRRLEAVGATRGRWEGKRVRRPLAKSTLTNALTLLRIILDEAATCGRVDTNPARGVAIPRYRAVYGDRTKERVARALDPLEVARLLGAIRGTDLETPVRLTLNIGWRLGEMRGVRVEDLEIEDERVLAVVIRRQVEGRTTKSGKPRRVPVARADAALFFAYVALRSGEREGDAFAEWQPFRGTRWSKRLGEVGRKLGMKRPLSWHDLRHTSAVGWLAGWWGEEPLSVRAVQARLGHASVVTTEGYLRTKTGTFDGR